MSANAASAPVRSPCWKRSAARRSASDETRADRISRWTTSCRSTCWRSSVVASRRRPHPAAGDRALADEWFEHDGQLTKADIRAITLSALAPRAGELLWDIGAGSGSIGIEWCLRHRHNRAIAFEERPERAARIGRNRLALGAPPLEMVEGKAPESFAGKTSPDAVFIGGGLTEPGLFEAAFAALKPRGRLVANAVTIEGEARLAGLFAVSMAGTCAASASLTSTPIGTMHGWRACDGGDAMAGGEALNSWPILPNCSLSSRATEGRPGIHSGALSEGGSGMDPGSPLRSVRDDRERSGRHDHGWDRAAPWYGGGRYSRLLCDQTLAAARLEPLGDHAPRHPGVASATSRG
jgi:precorrin-6Y C5,15-methyltransferase (decarboxylating) CbiT subunit